MQEVAAWDFNAAALLKNVLKTPCDVNRFYADPETTARGFGFSLSKQVAADIAVLNVLADLPEAKDEVDEEVTEFFYKTVADGRYISEWHTAPAEVAQKLGIDISPEALFRIGALATNQPPDRTRGPTFSPIARVVVAGIVVIGIIVIAVTGIPVLAVRMDKPRSPVFQPGDVDRL